MNTLTAGERYKLLTSTITPRPIAWITTLDAEGQRNAAPFSCFNVMGHTPPLVAVGLQPREDGDLKDTAANILATGEFVVNLVTARDGAPMVATSAELGSHEDELAITGIATTPSSIVAPPRIASAPVALECRLFQAIRPSDFLTIVLGEIVMAHVVDDAVLDAGRVHIDTGALELIARMQGPGWYVGSRERFQILP